MATSHFNCLQVPGGGSPGGGSVEYVVDVMGGVTHAGAAKVGITVLVQLRDPVVERVGDV